MTSRTSAAERLFLPPDYVSRALSEYFDDGAVESIRHQPDVYPAVASIARSEGASTIVDVGCGRAIKLMELGTDFELVGIDDPRTIADLRSAHPGHDWIGCDLELDDPEVAAAVCRPNSVVVCSDVIEHLVNPWPLLRLLSAASVSGQIVVISTPDRVRVRGADDVGPPANRFHVREWRLDELEDLLRAANLAPTFIGYTVNNDRDLQKRTILAVVDQRLARFDLPPERFRVEAIVSTHNEQDIAPAVVAHLLQEGVDVTVLDNWSNDRTWDAIAHRFDGDPRVRLLRHPEDGSSKRYEWQDILRRKEVLGQRSDADWIIHHDGDEIRTSPWPGLSLRTALWNLDRVGYTAIDHTVIDFRPTSATEVLDVDGVVDPESYHHFEWGRRPGHFAQVKAWKNSGQRVDLSSSGGHVAEFAGRRVAPYKFLLRHYPLRGPSQARRKILDRASRVSPAERELGWHTQYEGFTTDDAFVWSARNLETWEPREFHREFLLERLTGVGIVR